MRRNQAEGVLYVAGAWLEVLQNLLAAMHVPHRIVIGKAPYLDVEST